MNSSRWIRFAPLSLYLIQIPLYAGYLTDDSYIYAQFARNLARHGELVFQRGEWVHAATSPLWAGIGAIGVLLGFDGFLWLKLCGIACGAIAVWWMSALCFETFESPRIAALAASGLALEPWFVRWSMSGMETALGALCVVAILRFGWGEPSRRRVFVMALAAGLGPLVRPELILFLTLLLVRVLTVGELRRNPSVWIAMIAPLALWSALALPVYGTVWPETAQAKSNPLGLDPARLMAGIRSLGLILLVAVPAALIGLGLAAARILRGRAWRSWLEPVLWLWILALPTIYLLRDVFAVSRYYEVILPFVLVLGAVELLGTRTGRMLWFAQLLAAAVLTTAWIAPSTRSFSETMDRGLGDIATWLRENSAADDVVAIYDIGIVGYRSERRILDLGGLIEPGLNDLRDSVDDEEIVRAGLFLDFGNPRYLVHRAPTPELLADAQLRDRTARPIMVREVSNLGLRQPEPVYYTLYRLDRAGEATP